MSNDYNQPTDFWAIAALKSTEPVTVRRHFWVDGVLQEFNADFDSIENATLYLSGNQYHSAKIFNFQGNVIREYGLPNTETYA